MCSMQVVDITLIKHRLTSITSIRVVQQKHRRSTVCLQDYNFQHTEDLQNLLNMYWFSPGDYKQETIKEV
jgi:hypothetical protein